MDFSGTNLFGSTLQTEWQTALEFGADNSFSTPRTASTATSNALQSMQPITADTGGSWSQTFQDLLKGVVGYAVQKDAVKSNLSQQPPAQPAYIQVPTASGGQTGGMMMLAIAAVAGIVLVKVLK